MVSGNTISILLLIITAEALQTALVIGLFLPRKNWGFFAEASKNILNMLGIWFGNCRGKLQRLSKNLQYILVNTLLVWCSPVMVLYIREQAIWDSKPL